MLDFTLDVCMERLGFELMPEPGVIQGDAAWPGTRYRPLLNCRDSKTKS